MYIERMVAYIEIRLYDGSPHIPSATVYQLVVNISDAGSCGNITLNLYVSLHAKPSLGANTYITHIYREYTHGFCRTIFQ